jgi:Holliday junction resolvase RusA-like endonuclease
MKSDEFSKRFPNASKACIAANNPKLRSDSEKKGDYQKTSLCPVVERVTGASSSRKVSAKERDTRRFLVRVVSYRRKLIDVDNLCEKYVVDCCRYAGVLPDDGPAQTQIEVRQEKVGNESEEKTVVEVWQLPDDVQ